MSNKWLEQVYLTGYIPDVIKELGTLKGKYPGDRYELRRDQDREIWVVDLVTEHMEEKARIKHDKKAIEKEERKMLTKLRKKYKE